MMKVTTLTIAAMLQLSAVTTSATPLLRRLRPEQSITVVQQREGNITTGMNHSIVGGTVECSCTPTEYTFVVDASKDCTFDTVKGNPGVGSTFCFLGSTPVTREVVEITSVQFIEFDTSGKLIVIKQDDTYRNISHLGVEWCNVYLQEYLK